MIDARGLSCPQPVLMVQQEVKKNTPKRLTVLVDDQCAVGNTRRFANNLGYDVKVTENGDEFTLELSK
ncbi:MAG: sulfurtransferase TusA family protein [Oscillospiraceae bacterium]|nr:sulfurtransferase TusA family protein [Oscillospiraceae bacterium]